MTILLVAESTHDGSFGVRLALANTSTKAWVDVGKDSDNIGVGTVGYMQHAAVDGNHQIAKGDYFNKFVQACLVDQIQ